MCVYTKHIYTYIYMYVDVGNPFKGAGLIHRGWIDATRTSFAQASRSCPSEKLWLRYPGRGPRSPYITQTKSCT